MNTNDNASIEIDVLYLLRKLWSKKFFIVFVGLLVGTIALLGSVFFIKPKYTSTTRIYVVSRSSDTTLTNQDLQAGSYLVNDYKEVITSSEVLASVIDQEKLSMSAGQLSGEISVNIPTDTRVISISVTDTDAQRACDIANTVREVAAEKIKAVTKVDDVTTLESATKASHPSSPNVKKNAAIGFLAGAFVAIVGILVAEVLDDRVRRPEDIEEVLGLTLLGVVPDADKL
ncbi:MULTISPECIES: Wzz/FepE/Etk N-terminal domain-containing protein [Streptococcus]|jgi:MPA1 family polysaccharide export protein|uniref:Capsular polysaccharide biosynthesis protein CpsC n=1 Tax=Streptococcus equinus TaxID=1335 RepID=A0A1G9IP00_STREI|nr:MULTISPECIES: Wzz/FepE/Etk N-terminal domain-containing protein [Streptococcus]MDO4886773.1 Wzz/FepE/Etk N-terminal domain-containing protein [Streptococcus sp.]SDL26882.1 polysaccharide export protein, MPA1 family [Streptococcus equinus]SDQ27961.1 polysaccharide export protein, MPA1 family [Streptococcus equinus]SEI78793.1 polysaccharide export protein, MPA1 family [Streptococcus equinus]SEP62828.1 polysaccharide export protein, MPA1 family [Streptococcus equinus]